MNAKATPKSINAFTAIRIMPIVFQVFASPGLVFFFFDDMTKLIIARTVKKRNVTTTIPIANIISNLSIASMLIITSSASVNSFYCIASFSEKINNAVITAHMQEAYHIKDVVAVFDIFLCLISHTYIPVIKQLLIIGFVIF